MNIYDDLYAEIEEVRSKGVPSFLDQLIEDVLCDGDYPSSINKKYHCEITCRKEKHNSLQYTYYYTITSKLINVTLYLEVENGISNGTQLNSYSFHSSCEPKSRVVEVMKDIVLDESRYTHSRFSVDKARVVFPHHKDKILDLLRKKDYDSYVTGGGTCKTNSYYKDEFNKYEDMGLFWKCIYEEQEVDINFVN